MARLLRTLALAALEASVVGLPLVALTSVSLPWTALLGAVLVGWIADAVTLRLPPRLDRPALAAGALVALALLLAVGLGLGPLAALAALLPGSPLLGQAYLLALLALYLYWRGTSLSIRDGDAIVRLFGRGAAVMVAALVVGPLARPGLELPLATLAGYAVAFVSCGLLALALAHSEDEGGGARRLSWRWLLTLALAIGAVLAVAGLGTALLGGGRGLAAAQTILQAIMLPFAIVGAALAWLVFTLLAGPLAWIAQVLRRAFERLPEAPEDPGQSPAEFYAQDPGSFITGLATSATWLMALIPVIILLVAIFVLRRRSRPRRAPDEERESLGVAEGLAADLRDLLSRLRNPFGRGPAGLRAALAALRGDDPVSRVRRSYLRLLIGLEERDRPRPAALTPAEFAATAAAAVGPPAPVDALTRAYERARYDPAGLGQADAAAAEAALAAIELRSGAGANQRRP